MTAVFVRSGWAAQNVFLGPFAGPCAIVKLRHQLSLAVVERHSYILYRLAPNSPWRSRVLAATFV